MYIWSKNAPARAPRGSPRGQKVHRSCSWLSLLKLLLAEASGFCACRVESSPFKLFLHTGHVSCCKKTGRGAQGNGSGGAASPRGSPRWAPKSRGCLQPLPALTRARCSCCGRSGCRVTAAPARPPCSPPYTRDTPSPYLEERRRAGRAG